MESADEMTHVAVAAHTPEVVLRLRERRTDSALDHGAASPTLDVAGVGLHRRGRVLDRIGGSQCSLQRKRPMQPLLP